MPAELTLPVSGMTCGGCENAVIRAVSALPGVSAVTASHQANQVIVTHDPALITKDQIAAKISALGYQVHAT